VGTGVLIVLVSSFYIFIFGYCARLIWPHSAFQSTLNSSIVSYRIVLCSSQSVAVIVIQSTQLYYSSFEVRGRCFDGVENAADASYKPESCCWQHTV